MKIKYIPRRYVRRNVGIEGRMTSILGGLTLIAVSPIYGIYKGISEARYYLTGKEDDAPNIDELIDTIKLCYHNARYGRFPDAIGKQ